MAKSKALELRLKNLEDTVEVLTVNLKVTLDALDSILNDGGMPYGAESK
jgi:hypothetical protein